MQVPAARGLRAWSLVCFTLLSQMAAGVSLALGGARWWLMRSGEFRTLAELERITLPIVPALLLVASADAGLSP